MSAWSRLRNVFRGDRVNREIDEELASHLEEAIEEGRDPEEARRLFGSALLARESSRDFRVSAWLDSLRADIVFGWRQLLKNRVTSGAAILSLALAIGACTSAFRLIDAVLLRPLPVADPGSLYVLTYDIPDRAGSTGDSFVYPLFRTLHAVLKDDAELMAISYASRIDITYSSDDEMEKASRQFVSGWTMASLGLRPKLGRLLITSDDLKPGAHPYAVLSYDYWTRRHGQDPKVIGRSLRINEDVYEIVGVLAEGFTGTDTGLMTDIFIPTMMNAQAINNPNWSWFRTWVRLRPWASEEQVRERLQAAFSADRGERVKTWDADLPKEWIERYVSSTVHLNIAASGTSSLQKDYRRSLLILGTIAALVLLIACANVANLMTAQAAARAREMALRVSIGAGRWRLVQLVLVESLTIAAFASLLGGLFAWWSAPFVVSQINPPDNPLQLVLPADWRVLGFAGALALGVSILFGLAPALRASSVKPANALKGGEDPHSRRRLMNSLIAAQVAFCFLVHFIAGLFIATFERLSTQPTGFAAQGLLILEANSRKDQPQETWAQVEEHLRSSPGVTSAALCSWPLMGNSAWVSDIFLNGKRTVENPYFLGVSSAWFETMRIPMLDGRTFRKAEERVAIVNESFARVYLNGENPVGKFFERPERNKEKVSIQIVGLVGDALYKNARDGMKPIVFIPLGATSWGSFMVRASGDTLPALASTLRQEVPRARSEFRVSNIRTQEELVRQHTIRERLLAMLSLFFAVVALILASVGLYGVLSYTVLQRTREIGIRMALGAQPGHVARKVTAEVFGMLVVGAVAGLAAGLFAERYIESLLYQVKATDAQRLVLPALTIFVAALLAALPPVLRAVHVDPATALRSE